MAVQNEILRARLREAFGADPQETVAQKLHLTQGTISKILSGAQQPALETMYHVANEYNVSVDWLLGISDKKRITKENGENNYCSVVEAIHSLRCHGVAKIDTGQLSKQMTPYLSIFCGNAMLYTILIVNCCRIGWKRSLLYLRTNRFFIIKPGRVTG